MGEPGNPAGYPRNAVWKEPKGAVGLEGGMEVTIQEAKQYVGRPVSLGWTGRKGDEIHDSVYVFSVGFVPMYGPCLITDKGEICLDRVVSHEPELLREAS